MTFTKIENTVISQSAVSPLITNYTQPIIILNSNTTLSPSVHGGSIIIVDTSGGAVTLTLPDAISNPGANFSIIRSGGSNLIVNRAGADNILAAVVPISGANFGGADTTSTMTAGSGSNMLTFTSVGIITWQTQPVGIGWTGPE